jgi:hypothetical protein
LPFDSWWSEIVFSDDSLKLSRKNLVRAIRDQDGGSHFDPILRDPSYITLKERLPGGVMFAGEQPSNPLAGANLVSMRQISYELLTSLEARKSST